MKILCIGDSNTYGYDPRSFIGSRYPEDVRWTARLNDCSVINAGVNGLTVPRDASVYAGYVRNNDPGLIIIMLGTNDLLEGTGADETAGRMEDFVCSVTELGKPVLLIAPPVLQQGDWVTSDGMTAESRLLGPLYREAAARQNCFFADSGEWGIEVLFDGVHFSPEGHAVFASELEVILNDISASLTQ